jgi:hypothetical protein
LLGLPDTIPAATAIEQLLGGLISAVPENQEKINFYLAFMVAQNPKSLHEAQLIIHLLATHKLCTRMLKKAEKETWPEGIDRYTNIAMKLSRGYKQGIEALAKFRRDGRQSFYVEHVNILQKDPQTVIGNVERGVS